MLRRFLEYSVAYKMYLQNSWGAGKERELPQWVQSGIVRSRGAFSDDVVGSVLAGYWWRWSRSHLSTRLREQMDEKWIELYGREAYDLAVAATAWVLELPHPPEEDEGSLSYRAASGNAELWPAHTPTPLRSQIDDNAAMILRASESALPMRLPAQNEEASREPSRTVLRARTSLALGAAKAPPAPPPPRQPSAGPIARVPQRKSPPPFPSPPGLSVPPPLPPMPLRPPPGLADTQGAAVAKKAPPLLPWRAASSLDTLPQPTWTPPGMQLLWSPPLPASNQPFQPEPEPKVRPPPLPASAKALLQASLQPPAPVAPQEQEPTRPRGLQLEAMPEPTAEPEWEDPPDTDPNGIVWV